MDKRGFIIANSEDDFKEKCGKYAEKNIHFLQNEINKKNLIWKKSKGPISDLREYFVKQEEVCYSFCEENILNEEEIKNERIIIISAEPGMGKSTILDKFTQSSNSETFFLKIVLNNFAKNLNDLKEKKIQLGEDQDPIEFMLVSLLRKNDALEISLLKNLFKERKLILMFDGIDEVIQYKDEVKNLIITLKMNYKFMKILLTTRNHLKSELEDYFETVSFNLNNFDEDDQKNFLCKYWCDLEILKNHQKRLGSSKLKRTAEVLIKKVRSTLNKTISDLIGIPLQTKMIADIFFDKLESNEDFVENYSIGNIAHLYQKFIEKKIKIQIEEKDKIEIENNKKRIERDTKFFYSDHIKLSHKVIIEDINVDLDLSEEEITKYGLIVNFNDKNPTFLHQSFAEFFLAKGLLMQLEHDDDNEKVRTQKALMQEVLKESRYFLIRRFLNDLLENNTNIKHRDTHSKLNYDAEIENCSRENLPNILGYLIEKREANIKSENKFLVLASENGNKDVVKILLKQEIDLNQKDYSGINALHLASKYGHKEIAELLIEKGIDINQKDSEGQIALHFASENGHKEIVNLFIQNDFNASFINQKNSFGQNALHMASKYGHKEIVEILIEKGIDINQKDNWEINALHWASKNGHKEIVEILIEKGIDINHKDNWGQNALHLASENGHKEVVVILIQKGIDTNQKDTVGQFALHLASKNGHKEIVEILILDIIDINQKNKWGDNPLALASKNGHKEIVEILIQKGIDTNQKN